MYSYNNCFHSVWLLLRRLQVNIDSCLFAPSSVIKSIALLRFSDNGCNRRRFDSLTARSCCLCSKATCFQRLNMKHSDVMRFLRMFWQCSKKQQDDYVHALVTWNLVASLVLQINMCAKLIFFCFLTSWVAPSCWSAPWRSSLALSRNWNEPRMLCSYAWGGQTKAQECIPWGDRHALCIQWQCSLCL